MKTRLPVLALSLVAAGALATGCDTAAPLPDDPAQYDRVSHAGGHCAPIVGLDGPATEDEFDDEGPTKGSGGKTKELPGESSPTNFCVIACEAMEVDYAPEPLMFCDFHEPSADLVMHEPVYDPDSAACVDVSANGTEYLFYAVGDTVALGQSVAAAQCRGDGAWDLNSVNVWQGNDNLKEIQ